MAKLARRRSVAKNSEFQMALRFLQDTHTACERLREEARVALADKNRTLYETKLKERGRLIVGLPDLLKKKLKKDSSARAREMLGAVSDLSAEAVEALAESNRSMLHLATLLGSEKKTTKPMPNRLEKLIMRLQRKPRTAVKIKKSS